MNDPTESFRKKRLVEINFEEKTRTELETEFGAVYSTDQLTTSFDVVGFMAPYVVVRRKSDGVKGSMEFTHSPRYYFNFQPE